MKDFTKYNIELMVLMVISFLNAYQFRKKPYCDAVFLHIFIYTQTTLVITILCNMYRMKKTSMILLLLFSSQIQFSQAQIVTLAEDIIKSWEQYPELENSSIFKYVHGNR